MTTETKVEAVARLEITAHGRGEWSAHESPEGMFVLHSQHAAAIAALEGERGAAERRVAELEAAAYAARGRLRYLNSLTGEKIDADIIDKINAALTKETP